MRLSKALKSGYCWSDHQKLNCENTTFKMKCRVLPKVNLEQLLPHPKNSINSKIISML
jgi:hypothetical protein